MLYKRAAPKWSLIADSISVQSPKIADSSTDHQSTAISYFRGIHTQHCLLPCTFHARKQPPVKGQVWVSVSYQFSGIYITPKSKKVTAIRSAVSVHSQHRFGQVCRRTWHPTDQGAVRKSRHCGLLVIFQKTDEFIKLWLLNYAELEANQGT